MTYVSIEAPAFKRRLLSFPDTVSAAVHALRQELQHEAGDPRYAVIRYVQSAEAIYPETQGLIESGPERGTLALWEWLCVDQRLLLTRAAGIQCEVSVLEAVDHAWRFAQSLHSFQQDRLEPTLLPEDDKTVFWFLNFAHPKVYLHKDALALFTERWSRRARARVPLNASDSLNADA